MNRLPNSNANKTPNIPMKRILSIVLLSVSLRALPTCAQVVVTNPISDILSQTQHVEDIAKTLQMINNQVQQINTLMQQLQQIQTYVKAFGDPPKLPQITGADSLVSSLKSSGVGQTIGQLQQAASGVAALQYDANGLYQSLGTTFTTPGGSTVQRSEDLYRKYGVIQQDSKNFQSVTDDGNSRRTTSRRPRTFAPATTHTKRAG